MKSAGMEQKKKIDEVQMKPTLAEEILNIFYATGTEQSKRMPVLPPVKALHPIHVVNFSSDLKKETDDMMKKGSNENEMKIDNAISNDDDSVGAILLTPDCYEMFISIKAVGYNIDSLDSPGFQILPL